MYFFEGTAMSPFKDGNDYLFLQLKQYFYEEQPLLNYAWGHLLGKSIIELYNMHPHHPATRSVMHEKLPLLAAILDACPRQHPVTTALLETYAYFTTGWRKQYMPLHSKVPAIYLAQQIPQLQLRCEQLTKEWPVNTVPADIALETTMHIITAGTTGTVVTYRQLLYTYTLLDNMEHALNYTNQQAQEALPDALCCTQFNTSRFATWYQQHHQQQLTREAADQKEVYLMNEEYKVKTADFSIVWQKPAAAADDTNPSLLLMLEPFFEHQKQLSHKTTGPMLEDKLPLGNHNMFVIAYIFWILFRKLGLEEKLPLKKLFTILCRIISFSGTPVVKPESITAYTQPKFFSITIIDKVIRFFQDCLEFAEKLKKDKGKGPDK